MGEPGGWKIVVTSLKERASSLPKILGEIMGKISFGFALSALAFAASAYGSDSTVPMAYVDGGVRDIAAGTNAVAINETIDFSGLSGPVAPDAFASSGLTVHLTNMDGTTAAAYAVLGGVTNSLTLNVAPPFYPTAAYLDLVFSSGVSNVSLFFDNEGFTSGNPGRGTSTFTAYDAMDTTVSSGYLGSGGNVLVAGSDIHRLRLWNGTSAMPSSPTDYVNNWFFKTNSLTFAIEVPEPETYAMLLAGMGLIALAFKSRTPYHFNRPS